MILKAKERGDGRQLGAYLLRMGDNEHVELHELRGFVSQEAPSALGEIDAVGRGTRAKNFLFSLSLNPPPKERVPIETFESAINTIEQRLGLSGQPRAIFFHEKDGRRHAHAVWSRIDTRGMKAIPLPHYKLKLRDVARELYLEHGWQMPRGFVSSKERDPFNCTLKEWQQIKRGGHDRKAIQQMFRECWAISDSGKAFAQALKARGYTLARGDRRGYVAVDYRGEVYSISRYAGVHAKQVRGRIGDPAHLPSVEQVQQEAASRMTARLRILTEQAERANRVRSAALRFQYTETIQRQRDEREKLTQAHELRWNAENNARAQRLSKGFRGVWDRLTGKYAESKRQNEREALFALRRDREEKDALVFRHIEEGERLQQRIRDERSTASLEVMRLHRDIAAFTERNKGAPNLREQFRGATGQGRDRGRSRDRDFEPEL